MTKIDQIIRNYGISSKICHVIETIESSQGTLHLAVHLGSLTIDRSKDRQNCEFNVVFDHHTRAISLCVWISQLKSNKTKLECLIDEKQFGSFMSFK